MTALTVTISESISFISPGETNKWGTFVWGTDDWGEKDIAYDFFKYLAESVTATDTLSKLIKVYYTGDDISLTDDITYIILANNGWWTSKDGITNATNWPVSSFIEAATLTDNWTESSTLISGWTQS